MAILPIIVQILALLPSLVAAGHDISQLVSSAIAAINSGSTDPTAEQWAALDQTVKTLQAQLDA